MRRGDTYKAAEVPVDLDDAEWIMDLFKDEMRRNHHLRLPLSMGTVEKLVSWFATKGVDVTPEEAVAAAPGLAGACEELWRFEELKREMFEVATKLMPMMDAFEQRTDLDTEAHHVARSKVLALYDRMVELSPQVDGEPVPDNVVAELQRLKEEHILGGWIRNERSQQEQAERRAQRIRERQEARSEPTVMEGTRCSVCEKKPARIDGMCKKCARAAGVIVHGKIGES